MTRQVVQTFAEWRAAARDLVARQIAPEYVEWASEPEEIGRASCRERVF